MVNTAEIRKLFPILNTEVNGKPLVYFDNGATTQKPKSVIDCERHYYEKLNANIHRGVHHLSQISTDAFEASRKAVQSFINAKHSEEIIFTNGTTEGINIVAQSFRKSGFVGKGDEILISALEHHSNIVPWQMLAEEVEATVKVVPFNEKGELDTEAFRSLINQRTKIVAISHISNALGSINPIKKFIDWSHALGIPVLIDGAQAAPHCKLDMQELDADFYTFSAHKMYGPTGVGVLYGKRDWLNKMEPVVGGGEMIATVSFDKTTYAELPHKFEAGTPNIAGVIALKPAIEFIEKVGFDEIHAIEQQLLDYATEKLSALPDVRIIGTAENKASLVSFIVDGVHPYDIGTILDKMGIAVRTGHHCAQPIMDQFKIPGTIRASFAIYNTTEEIDALVKGLERAINMLK
ncbi:aminotransferase class V-fold PLP-dependent enzyme [Luteibaculum oceani]|uniref:Probable cysteine desulfurase n=1 Tax=Luteibaculum oceani TaxID=1294296 RepID=A0A5C6VJI2_9FLAO|nr:cysteine desulfurase [Luteibaculum oceani]TXC85477.1 cysteine desulfurase [Luteibaculum oceani]